MFCRRADKLCRAKPETMLGQQQGGLAFRSKYIQHAVTVFLPHTPACHKASATAISNSILRFGTAISSQADRDNPVSHHVADEDNIITRIPRHPAINHKTTCQRNPSHHPSRCRVRQTARAGTRGLPSATRPPETEHRTPNLCLSRRGFAASRETISLQSSANALPRQQRSRSGKTRLLQFAPIRVHSWFKTPPDTTLRLSVKIRANPWRWHPCHRE